MTHPIQMPDGAYAATLADAAKRLGITVPCVQYHLKQHGHLRFASTKLPTARPAVKLAVASWETPVDFDPRPETAPRHRGLVSTPRAPGEELLATMTDLHREASA